MGCGSKEVLVEVILAGDNAEVWLLHLTPLIQHFIVTPVTVWAACCVVGQHLVCMNEEKLCPVSSLLSPDVGAG